MGRITLLLDQLLLSPIYDGSVGLTMGSPLGHISVPVSEEPQFTSYIQHPQGHLRVGKLPRVLLVHKCASGEDYRDLPAVLRWSLPPGHVRVPQRLLEGRSGAIGQQEYRVLRRGSEREVVRDEGAVKEKPFTDTFNESAVWRDEGQAGCRCEHL